MDDNSKRGGQLASELFTMILCGLNFAVSVMEKAEIQN